MSEMRERYEWCRFWWDSDEGDLPRALLIGDSITVAYRPFVTELIGDSCRVDMLATSKAVDSPALLREIDDLYEPMVDHPQLHAPDGVHFAEEGSRKLAHIVSSIVAQP